MLIVDQAELRIGKLTRDKELHYIKKKGPILQEDKTILNIIYLRTTHENTEN